jgi:hypothetical protein
MLYKRPNDAFYAEIEKLSLSELELKIKKLYVVFQKSRSYKNYKLEACLCQRKHLINKDFVFTPLALQQIERVNTSLTVCTAKVLAKATVLNQHMKAAKLAGDDFLNDYDIEATVRINYWDEASVLILDVDEKNGQSDYVAMANIMANTATCYEHFRWFHFCDRDNMESNDTDETLSKDYMLKDNWNIELLSAHELSHIDYFCYASYVLFIHSNYSLSDIIRIKDFCNEVKVAWENIYG